MNTGLPQVTTSPARRLASIAGASVIAFAVAIWLLAGQSDGSEPPDLISRPLASAVLLGAPGLVGLIGAATGRRTVLVAAGVTCLFQSAISVSGVTLIYLVPAILFLRSATDEGGSSSSEPIRPLRVALAAVVAVPIALILILNVGFLGVVLLAIVAGLASSRRRGGQSLGLTGGEAARGAAIVLLVVGAWAATLVLAETVCWTAQKAPGGGVTWERIPPSNTLTLEAGDVSAGCAGGTITPIGAVVAAGFLLLAMGVAAFPDRRRGRFGGGDPAASRVAGA
jgi:hypothetical protein